MADVRPARPGDPATIGKYEIVGVLGEGGQGTVYLGRLDGRDVAVKLLHSRFTDDDEARARFVRELEVAKKVARFCTAQVLDADLEGDRPYIVSEFVDGRSLQDQVEREGPRSEAALERLAISTLTALAAIHQAGIIHRDFKPHNVLLAEDGPRVIDFGIARALNVTSHSHNVGTPSYMSPEQLNGHQLTAASDLFSWAASMVFAATGRPPFGNEEIGVVLYRIAHLEPEIGELPSPLNEVVEACLVKDPAGRPSAAEAQQMLMGGTRPDVPRTAGASSPALPVFHQDASAAQAPAGAPQPVYGYAPPTETTQVAGRKPALLVIGALAIAAVLGTAGWAVLSNGGKHDPKWSTPTVSLNDTGEKGQDAAKPGKNGVQDSGSLPGGATPTTPKGGVGPSGGKTTAKPTPGGATPTPGQSGPALPLPLPTSVIPTLPTPTPTPKPTTNPYTAVQVCNAGGNGGGFFVQRSTAFPGGRVYQLGNDKGYNCAVTLKAKALDRKTNVWARLVRRSDGKVVTDRGLYQYYAGPVYVPAKGICVRYAGGGPGGRAASGWGNCR